MWMPPPPAEREPSTDALSAVDDQDSDEDSDTGNNDLTDDEGAGVGDEDERAVDPQ